MKNLTVNRAFTAKKNINLISKRSTFILSILFFLLTAFTMQAWCDVYSFGALPTSGSYWNTAGGSITTNGVTWSYSSSTYIANNNGSIQIGSGSNPQTTDWTIQAPVSSFSETITKVAIIVKTTSGDATYDISVGGTSQKSGTFNATLDTYSTSTIAVTSGNIVITLRSSSKAMFLQNIYVYSGASGGSNPGGNGKIEFKNSTSAGVMKIDGASVNGTDNLGSVWFVNTTGTSSFTPNANWGQVGSSSAAASQITFTTDLGCSNSITAFSAKFGGYSGTAGTVNLKIDGTPIKTGYLSGTSDVTITADALPANGQTLTVTITGISKGVKCYYISYSCAGCGSVIEHTVTLKDDNSTLTGTSVTLPNRSGCPGYSFAGWTKTWTAPQTTWTAVAPTIIPAGTYSPANDEELYPVYTDGTSISYVQVTSAPSDWSGQYLLVGYYESTTYTATGNNDGYYLLKDAYSAFNLEATDREFTLAKVSDNKYSLKRGSDYIGLYSSTSTKLSFSTDAPTSSSTSYLWTPSTNGLTSVSKDTRKIATNNNVDFRAYSNPTEGIAKLYKRTAGAPAAYISDCGANSITVTLSYLGNGEEEQIELPEPYNLPTSIAAEKTCDGWDFLGWSLTPVANTTTMPTMISSLTAGDNGAKVYAVYKQGIDGGVTFNFGEIADEAGWVHGEPYSHVEISPVTITVAKGSASYYARWWNTSPTWTEEWRIYENNTITISSSVGEVLSVISNPTAPFIISGGEATLVADQKYYFTTITVIISEGGGIATYTTACQGASSDELEIVEWDLDHIDITLPPTTDASVIIEDKDPYSTTANYAVDIFFSKYFEAGSNMKLFALYNGTDHDIDMKELRVRSEHNSGWAAAKGEMNYVELKDVSKLGTEYPGFLLPPGKEIIFWSNNKGSSKTSIDNNTALRECVSMTIGGANYTYDEMEADAVPNWYCLGHKTSFNVVDADGNNQFTFNGDDPLVLERNISGTWTAIDLIGAAEGTPTALTINKDATVNISTQYHINGTDQALNDGKGWVAYTSGGETLDIPYSTNRYLLIRKNHVKSGANAVAHNQTNFKTLGDYTIGTQEYPGEWMGVPVGGSRSAMCYSGEKFSQVGQFDYNESYSSFVQVGTYEDLGGYYNPEKGTYTIPLALPTLPNMACTKMKINLYDGNTILATNFYDVPIMVTENTTTDALFSNRKDGDLATSRTICADCDVVILKGGTLTKANNGAAKDVTQIRNLMVYPGGKLDIPLAGGEYNIKSLQFRVEGDTYAPYANLNGDLIASDQEIKVSRRINNQRYYFFSLPYDCNIADIRWSSGSIPILGTDYIILEYDGDKRAQTANVKSWKKVTTQLKAGVGYNIAVSHDHLKELVFPMALGTTNVTDAERTKGATPGVPQTEIHQYTDPGTTINNWNWNLVAHPYISKFAPYEGDDIKAGYPKWNSASEEWTQEETSYVYLTIPPYSKTSRIEAGDYTQKLASTITEIDPFLAVFVQAAADGNLAFSQANRRASAPARHLAAKSEYTDESIFVGVKLSNGDKSDQANLRIRPDFTDEYQLGYDLAKYSTQSSKRPIIFTRSDNSNLAFRALSDSAAAVAQPLFVNVPAEGLYTFTLSEDYPLDNVEAVYLLDDETGITTNLLNDTYSFEIDERSYIENRFALSVIVRRPAPGGLTDIDPAIATPNMTRKILINGHVYILRDNKVYDVTGKQMSNH